MAKDKRHGRSRAFEKTKTYFCGAGAGVCAGADCCAGAFAPCKTELPPLLPREAMMESVIDVSIKMTTPAVVAFDKADCAPRGPNVLWVPPPPNAPARSAPLLL